MGDTAEITRLARGQAQKVDRVFTEALERLRIQVIRADQILTGPWKWWTRPGRNSEYLCGARPAGYRMC